jgi:hypothetical protein
MKFNVEEFKKVLKKATLNFSIDSVRLDFTKDTINSNMISERRDAVVGLNIPNDMMNLKKAEEIEMNFSQPLQQLMPFLNLIDEDEANVTFKENKIIISSGRQRSNIHFCSPEIVSVFETDAKETERFITLDVDDDFVNAFMKIKKIGSKFGDVYFNVEKNVFNIETTDRTNRFSNGLKLDLVDIKDVDDLSLRFDYKNFLDLMAVVNGNADEFQMSFSYMRKQDMGILLAEKEDEEKYYLMSRMMEENL